MRPHPAPTPNATPVAGAGAPRPLAYVLIVAVALVGALGVKLRTQGAFACPPLRDAPGYYLAYCQATGFGDYDHGAMWYGLEPGTREAAARADVLFLGNSRMQFALSSEATRRWFAGAPASYYLLGFSHMENLVFTTPLLDGLAPRARVYVINADQFFDERVTGPARTILEERDAPMRYREKHFWRTAQDTLCGKLPVLCGGELAFYRDRSTGAWRLAGHGDFAPGPVSDGPAVEADRWPRFAERARRFVAALPAGRECVLLTMVPTAGTDVASARAIAAALDVPLIAPHVDGLATFDGSHLDGASAERWSAAFFEAAAQPIRACLQASGEPVTVRAADRG